MSSAEPLELIARVEAQRTLLLSPGVGWFSAALPAATIVGAGELAGVLTTLEKRARLVVPAGVRGVVRSAAPGLLRAPVEYGQVLYELGALDVALDELGPVRAVLAEEGGELTLRSPQSGRFYYCSAPGEASLCEVGREIEVGTAVGLIEVMKTFTQVVYRAERGLPQKARIVRVVARDGGDVEEGAGLVVVAPR